MEAEISAFRIQRHDRARRLGHSPRNWVTTSSTSFLQPSQRPQGLRPGLAIQRRIDPNSVDAATFEEAQTFLKKKALAFKKKLASIAGRFGDRAQAIRAELGEIDGNELAAANGALEDQATFATATATEKLTDLVVALNAVEAKLKAIATELMGQDVDFSQRQQAIARVQELDKRFDELNEMRTGPVPVAALQDAYATMNAAKTAANAAATAIPYDQATAQNKTLDYVLAMDAFQNEAAQTLPEAIAQTMKFGTEFTFTKPAIYALDTEKNDQTYVAAAGLVATWEGHVRAKKDYKATIAHSPLDGGAAQEGQNAVQFTYDLPSGQTWWWKLDIDYGCLETQAKPTTENQAKGTWEGNQDNSTINGIIASHIFGLAETVGVAPHGEIGGGHLSLDRATTFGDNSRFLRNFLVLYINERGDWAQEDPDAINAPLITDLKAAGKAAFKDVIRNFDAAQSTPNAWSIQKLTDELNTKVFIAGHFAGEGPAKRKEQPAHYQATNLEHMEAANLPERRIEMRRFDAQTSLGDLLADMAKLTDLTARSRQPGLVPLDL